MKIAFVSQFVYPHAHEVRLKKISETLAADGHEVHVLGKWDPSQGRKSDVDGITVHRNCLTPRFPALNQALTLHLAFNPIWILWIWWKCRSLGVDLIIARNLRLSPPSIIAGRMLGTPVIADLSENYPALAVIEGKARFRDMFTRTPSVERFFERFTVRRAAHVWAVVEDNKNRLVELAQVSPEKLSVIGNVPTKAVTDALEVRKPVTSRSGPLTIVFLGIVDALRGLDVVVEAVGLANRRSDADGGREEPAVRLLIVGDGPARADLESLAFDVGASRDVEFTGWIDSDVKYDYLARGDFGIIPHVNCELCQTTVPNKLFDYMGAGIPVLATDLKPIREVLEAHECGLVVPWEPAEMADKFIQISRFSAEQFSVMGKNGRIAVESEYNWDQEEPKIRKTIQRIQRLHH